MFLQQGQSEHVEQKYKIKIKHDLDGKLIDKDKHLSFVQFCIRVF